MLSDKHVNTQENLIYFFRGCLGNKKKELQRSEQHQSAALHILQNNENIQSKQERSLEMKVNSQ